MWRRVSCEQQSEIVSDLLRKLERFRHAVVEPSCHGVRRSLARFRARECWRGFCRFPSSVVSSISVCASGQHVCCATPDATCSLAQGTQQGSKVILSFAPILTCHFLITFVHGSGAVVLTCGCCWVVVSMKYATGETSGYWYCGEVTQTWPLWMRLQEMGRGC